MNHMVLCRPTCRVLGFSELLRRERSQISVEIIAPFVDCCQQFGDCHLFYVAHHSSRLVVANNTFTSAPTFTRVWNIYSYLSTIFVGKLPYTENKNLWLATSA